MNNKVNYEVSEDMLLISCTCISYVLCTNKERKFTIYINTSDCKEAFNKFLEVVKNRVEEEEGIKVKEPLVYIKSFEFIDYIFPLVYNIKTK